MSHHEFVQKVTPEHLARKAIVYLRQSSLAQVKHNKESEHLQYALVERAKVLGFNHVDVIDRDLGVSAAAGSQQREGFKQLLAPGYICDMAGRIVKDPDLRVQGALAAHKVSGTRYLQYSKLLDDPGVSARP